MAQAQVFEKTVYRIAGDTGLLVEFGEGIDETINTKVRAMAKALELAKLPGISETIPTYKSLLMIYDPLTTNPDRLKTELAKVESGLDNIEIKPPKVVEIPVCYGSEFGPDIETVARINALDIDQVIDLHSAREYLIYMVGFTPGFPFLGGLDKRLSTPRLENPRTLVPAGSVGIANNQTGMYPIASPGGWQIIGRTPLTLFSPERKNPFLYKAGDKIKFKSVTEQGYEQILKKEAD